MTIADNKRFAAKIETLLKERLPIKLGVNKRNELVRLIFEICCAQGLAPPDVLEQAELDASLEEGRGELFHRFKEKLLKIRYPTITLEDNPHLMPLKIDEERQECPIWNFELDPIRIFVEDSVKDLEWTGAFTRQFPGAEVVPIGSLRKGLEALPEKDPTKLYNSRRESIFLVRNKSAFIKVCPCTKGYKRCGYWILNLGFGCPIDCSYCYLQMYSNSPGIIFPANIEEYYDHIKQFNRKVRKRTRIGTGEFTDSLAFDRYTAYSSRLIPFFRERRNLVLELKTKISQIDNVLSEDPHENVVISWSMNTIEIAEKYEKGGSSVSERIDAALRAAERGYKVGFHFDPIVHYPGWEDDYKAVVGEIFSKEAIRANTAWISLGTLRYTPGLKQAAEQRFGDNLMFYQGEFFIDTDGKLRYPRKVRIDIYNKMINWIRSFDTPCWIYLCMEPEGLWKKTGLILKSKYHIL
ncbi:MAG: radical SAM protein [Candidatus Omnitrophota bacterium]